jgi:two-component system phosphate regulon sensor histidine kinase PhoR
VRGSLAGAGALEVDGPGGRLLLIRVRPDRSRQGSRWVLVEDVSELRRLQRIRTQFIDNLSHELRTPLTSIRLLTERLTDELASVHVPERVRDRVASIDVETGHLVQMVNEILELSRIEGGSSELRSDDVPVSRLLGSAVDRVRTFAERQSVTLNLEPAVDGAPLVVRGDEQRLEQVLVNLLHNAVKFSDAGATVKVNAERRDGMCLISVADSGVGIPRGDVERVFERFYKVDKARHRGGGGTGLGLSIARHIVEGHGGRIWVESEEGRGSTFTFSVPLARQAQPLTAEGSALP